MTTYLQDLAEGQKIETERRVVSDADIDAFCELSGDHNPLHHDTQVAALSCECERPDTARAPCG